MRWLVCDYGGVLSHDQPPADRASLVALSGERRESAFWARYWRHRPAYDRADLRVEEYWAAVLGSAPAVDRVADLVAADVAGWTHPNLEALAAADRAATRGFRRAVLSNAPTEVARAIDRLPWLAAFEPRLYSCDLRAIKPEPAVYRSLLATLGVDAGAVVFLDDREENVVAAAALGIEAHLFEAAARIDALQP